MLLGPAVRPNAPRAYDKIPRVGPTLLGPTISEVPLYTCLEFIRALFYSHIASHCQLTIWGYNPVTPFRMTGVPLHGIVSPDNTEGMRDNLSLSPDSALLELLELY